jgi:superfamily I DNA and/or RNA helicase
LAVTSADRCPALSGSLWNNSALAALRRQLPEDIRVGTVDKFQGQEAPVVIYSLTSSSAADAPRALG